LKKSLTLSIYDSHLIFIILGRSV